jgi:hypothetical protein
VDRWLQTRAIGCSVRTSRQTDTAQDPMVAETVTLDTVEDAILGTSLLGKLLVYIIDEN